MASKKRGRPAKKHQVNIRMDKKTFQELKWLAKRAGSTRTDLVSTLIHAEVVSRV